MSTDTNPYALAGRYVRDGHSLDDAAGRFGLDPDELRAYLDKPLGTVSDTSLQAVSERNTAVSRQTDTSDTSDTASQNADLLAGIRTGDWLDAQTFPPLRYAVPGVIPEGFTLLVGAPKAGKSYLALALLLARSSGGVALGRIPTGEPRRVLYVALEDGDRRMQSRCRDLLEHPYRPDDPIPALFSYVTRVTPSTIVATIEAFLDTYPDTALVVIDTLGKVMPPPLPNETTYGRDYRVGSRLKLIADERPGLSITALHHDRKATSDDFVERVSGTNGLAGAADTIIVLHRKRQSRDGLLMVTGRDVPEGEYAVTMAGTGVWTLDGADLADAAETARRRAEESTLSDLSADIWAFVRTGGAEGVARKEVAQKFGANADKYLARLVEAGRIERAGRGRYRDPSDPLSEVSEVSETQVSGASETDTETDSVRNEELPLDDEEPTHPPPRCSICLADMPDWPGDDWRKAVHDDCERDVAHLAENERAGIIAEVLGLDREPSGLKERREAWGALVKYIPPGVAERGWTRDDRILMHAANRVGRDIADRLDADWQTMVEAELADVQSWTHTEPGRGKPGVGRAIITVSHNPHGWRPGPGRGGYPLSYEVCQSIFDRIHCENPVVWKVETRRDNKILTHYLCDEHFSGDRGRERFVVPADFDPEEPQ